MLDAAGESELISAVEAELTRGLLRVGFGRLVEAHYAANIGPRRARWLRLASPLAVLLYDLFLIPDRYLVSDIYGWCWWTSLTVITPVVLLLSAFLGGGAPLWYQDLVTLSFCLGVLFSVAGGILQSASPHLHVYVFVLVLPQLYGLFIAALRFRAAVVCISLYAIVSVMLAFCPSTPSLLSTFLALYAVSVGLFLGLAAYRLERSERRAYLLALRQELRAEGLSADNQVLSALSRTDPLTGIANRRAFDEALQRGWARAAERRQRLGLLVIDVDHFKRYNDHYGHVAGDSCLRILAGVMQQSLREGDLLARYGGEEFAALLPDADKAVALAVAERVRRAVETRAMPHDGLGRDALVTVSIGAVSCAPAEESRPATLVRQADAALYMAKRSGRNRAQTELLPG